MAISTFKKTTLIVGAVSLLILLAVATLNIYWFNDETDIALDNCVSSHLKVIANAIMLIVGIVAALLFGIDFYKNKNLVVPKESEEVEKTPIVDEDSVKETLNKVSYREIFNYIQQYIEYTVKCYQTMGLYYSSMQSYLMTRTGLTDVSENQYLRELLDKIEELKESLEDSRENFTEASTLSKAIESGINILNRTGIKPGTPLYEQIMAKMAEDKNSLKTICLGEWQKSRKAEKLFDASKEIVVELSKNVDEYVAQKAWESSAINKLQ